MLTVSISVMICIEKQNLLTNGLSKATAPSFSLIFETNIRKLIIRNLSTLFVHLDFHLLYR